MYKGKFNQKDKKGASNVKDILAQRNSQASQPPRSADRMSPMRETPRQAPAQRPAARPNQPQAGGRPMPPQAGRAVPPQAASRQSQPAVPQKPQKKGPRLGSVIFYTLYFLFILIFFFATYLGLNWLNGWLVDFEASQPTVKAEQVFNQLFTDPDWASLYEAAGAEDSPYEGKEEYVTYMDEKMGDSKLTYLETSAGLSGDKKYIVRLGDEKVATFTLTDKNQVGQASLENLDEITKISDWQLGTVEVFFTRENSYRIVNVNGHRTLVNGVELNDDFTIQIATTAAEEYLPEGTVMPSMRTQEVSGLFTAPTVTIFNDKGEEVEVTYDEATATFTERTSSNTMTSEQEDAIKGAAQTYCLWMIKEVTDRAKVAKYFDSSSDTYSSIVKTTELWMQGHGGYNFSEANITGFNQYGDNLFSARISMALNVTRKDGTVKEYPYAQSMVFKKDGNKWLCTQATNVDITQPVGKVRLTFMVDGTQVLSEFFETDAEQIVTPTISPVPEGKVFSGWARKDTDESGVITYTIVFQPDDSSRVTISEGTTLEPMTLHALFEDASTASAPSDGSAEATPVTTEGGA